MAAARAGTRLALVAAWQYLPARQRAFLILRDVLGWPAADVADLLGTSTTAVNSGLRRARALVARTRPAQDEVAEPAGPGSRSCSTGSPPRSRTPTCPRWPRCSATTSYWRCPLADLVHRPRPCAFSRRGPDHERAVPAGAGPANGQPAFATYQREASGRYRAHAVQVLSLAPGGIARLDIFLNPGLFRVFGLPVELRSGSGRGGGVIRRPPLVYSVGGRTAAADPRE